MARRTRVSRQQEWRRFVQANRVPGQLRGLSILICKIRSHEAMEMSDYGYWVLSPGSSA